MLKHKFGEDGAMSFIKNLCNLGVAGSIKDTVSAVKEKIVSGTALLF